ncbi:unnamed protein product [Schistocephalus solidus]|uniref:Reverse transcriptase domain-containing protein n=1 Tax=Schistocephalus solidus TaxID=70667 RepID=A0A183TGF0_SCHSO|nr:unnamed protein product [Schistocephalus solidus]
MFPVMLTKAYREERFRICIAYWMDGRPRNQRRMHFRSRVSTATIHELLFADDCERNATIEEKMQRSMDLFAATCDNIGRRINTKNMVVMNQPQPKTSYSAAHINVNGTQLKYVDTFTYLCRNLSRNTQADDKMPIGDVTKGTRRQEGQKRRYEDTLKKSPKQLQINPATFEDLTQDRPCM